MKLIERTAAELADLDAKKTRARALREDFKILLQRIKKEPNRFVRLELTAEEWGVLKEDENFVRDDVKGTGTWHGLPVKREQA